MHGACGALQPAAPDIAPLCLHHMTRDLPALGRGWGIGVGCRMNQHFGNLFHPPAKGQYETKPKSHGAQNPCRLSKPNLATHDKFFGEKYGNWQEGRSSSSGTSGCLIEHSLSRRRCSCVIPQRYPTPAEDADGQNMDVANGSDPSCEHPLPVMMKYPWHAAPEM